MRYHSWAVEARDIHGSCVLFEVPYLNHPIWYDIVTFDMNMTRQDVLDSLINHDGYPRNIVVNRVD